VDDLPNMSPLDITTIGDALESGDGLTQDDILNSLFDSTHDSGTDYAGYESKTVSNVRLSAFRRNYEEKRSLKAISALGKRTRIVVDDNYMVDVEDDLLHYSANVHRLDFMCTVGDSIGLWTLLLNVTASHTFMFAMDLKKNFREFKAKYAKLGFDAAGRLCHIGRRDGIDHWIAFCPADVLAGVAPPVEVGYCTGDTRMKTKHYRMLVVFLGVSMPQQKPPKKLYVSMPIRYQHRPWRVGHQI
jgi:hypothetical protein